MTNDYHFITHWRIEASEEAVYDLISHPADYPRWWPSVYLDAAVLDPGGQDGLGRRVRFHTKGWLPYTLRWESCAIEKERPRRLVVRATGDFDGRGIWTLEQHGESVNVTFDWQLIADKPLLRYLSFLFKPAFAANHRWAMARGEESLRLELLRRRAQTDEARAPVPAPPAPNRTSTLWLGAGCVILLLLLLAAVRAL